MDYDELGQLVEVLHCVGMLKKRVRFGSMDNAANESVADHTNRVVFMSYFIAEAMDLEVDKYKCMKMALIHDLGEYLEGDVDRRQIARGEVTLEDKRSREKRAMMTIRELAPGKMGEELYALWNEYETGESAEARYVKVLDRAETMLHLAEMGHEVYDMPGIIPGFANNALKNYPKMTGMVVLLKDMLRGEFEKGGIPWKDEYNAIK